MVEHPWYEVVKSDEVLQGDFIKGCPVIIPPPEISDSEDVDVKVKNYDVVVMSQSCDIAQRKIDLVLICPVWPLRKFEEKSSFFKGKDGKEALRRGNVHGYHLLNKCEIDGFETDYLVVDFHNIYAIPLDFLITLVQKKEPRLRLLPPYREHLSQAFARFFMRVGLPVDIPPFKK